MRRQARHGTLWMQAAGGASIALAAGLAVWSWVGTNVSTETLPLAVADLRARSAELALLVDQSRAGKLTGIYETAQLEQLQRKLEDSRDELRSLARSSNMSFARRAVDDAQTLIGIGDRLSAAPRSESLLAEAGPAVGRIAAELTAIERALRDRTPSQQPGR